ncbi:MAG: ABC transporter permease [Fimbriimonadales bacterium]|nr:ABC transporter permease [Fimbriimonadales bacterium]
MAEPGLIADLSYRDYDGPLLPPTHRWWVIARLGVRLAFRKRAYWVVTALSSWYYLVMMAVLFFFEQAAQSAPGPRAEAGFEAFLQRIVWKDQFLHGFGFAQLLYLIAALMLGAGAIANDNRSKALLVILSKPCDKRDYLAGKWVGVFLPLFTMMLLPPLVFFLYGAFSYRGYGFLDNPWFFPKFLLVIAAAAAVHTSLVIGVSSLFDQGRLAGATYAGVYFLSNFFTQLMVFAWLASQGFREGRFRAMRGESPFSAYVDKLYYFSVDGLLIGLCKAILGTDGSPQFGMPSPIQPVPAPPLLPTLAVAVALSAAFVALAWSRIRAVEVVR